MKFNKKILNIVIIVIMTIVVVAMAAALINRIISPPVDATIDDDIKKRTVEEVIQINILNGCRVKGLAGQAKKYLHARDFDVVDVGNYKDSIAQSIVIDMLGDLSSAKKVAYALGINDSLIIEEIDSSMFIRSTVVLGADYKELKPFK
ncbi:MAG: LytR C-terminal domain-containing protein [Chlorobi bacterium]|nr:LytR C-terminal domain-containing protein [Chlorobiota bacterium]